MKTIHPAIAEHVIEENARLRGLLMSVLKTPRGSSGRIILEPDEEAAIRTALSQQAEPAPAQDDRHSGLLNRIDAAIKAFTSGRAIMHVPPEPDDVDVVLKECRKFVIATRPAQIEQQPVCWASSAALAKLQNGRNNSPCVLTDGPAEFNDTPLYAAPIAQTEQQPEQGGLVGQVCGGDGTHNTVNVAVVGPVPWGDLRIGTPVRLIPAPATPSPAQRGDA